MKVSKFFQMAKSQLFIWPPADTHPARGSELEVNAAPTTPGPVQHNSPQLCIHPAVVASWRHEAIL